MRRGLEEVYGLIYAQLDLLQQTMQHTTPEHIFLQLIDYVVVSRPCWARCQHTHSRSSGSLASICLGRLGPLNVECGCSPSMRSSKGLALDIDRQAGWMVNERTDRQRRALSRISDLACNPA